MADKKVTVKIITGPFRLAFPELVEAKQFNDQGSYKWSINCICDPGGETILAVRKALLQVAKEKWGDNREKWPRELKKVDFKTHFDPNAKNGFPIRDGDTVSWDGFEGTEFFKASKTKKDAASRPPEVVDSRKQPILDMSEVCGGLICRASLVAYAFERPDGSGVALALRNLQVLADDGTRYGGARAEDEFDEWSDGEETAEGDDF